MGREERLIYTRVMRLQGRERARVLRCPLKGEIVNNKVNQTPHEGQGKGGQKFEQRPGRTTFTLPSMQQDTNWSFLRLDQSTP